MGDLSPIAKLLIVIGIFFVAVGLFLLFSERIPFVGKLPGDIYIKRKGFAVYFPIVTCLLVSLILTLLMWLFGRR